MNKTQKLSLFGWFLTMSAPAWAKTDPGIDPTLFVIGVAGAFAAGVAVGYAVGKSSSSNSSNQDS